MKRRWIACLLALVMALGLVPQIALAQTDDTAIDVDELMEEMPAEDEMDEEIEELLAPEKTAEAEAEKQEEPAEPAAQAGTAYVTVEKFTIGQGYLREPMKVALLEGDTAATVMARALGEGAYQHVGALEDGFYITGITDPKGSATAVFPDFITQLPDAPAMGTRQTMGWLQAGDYTEQGGWMLAQNHAFGWDGMSDVMVADGDVLRMQFTVYGYGSDLGNPPWGGGDPAVFVANRDALIKKMADVKADPGFESNATWKKAYAYAVDVTSDLAANDTDIAGALGMFDGVEPETNRAPKLKDGVNPLESAVIAKNGTYRLNLNGIYEDADGDELSFEVSVDGASAVAAPKIYRFDPGAMGEHTLEFTASDGKDKAEQNYVVQLKVLEKSLAAPTGLRANTAGYNTIRLSFTQPKYAERYRIYRATSRTGKYVHIAQGEAAENTRVVFEDTGLVTGQDYYYKVLPTMMDGEAEVRGITSGVVHSKPVPPRAGGFNVRRGAGKNLWLNWNRTRGAQGYLVYRSTQRNGGYTLQSINEGTTNTSYVDRNTQRGVQYFYKVISYRMTGNQRIWGLTAGPRTGTTRS